MFKSIGLYPSTRNISVIVPIVPHCLSFANLLIGLTLCAASARLDPLPITILVLIAGFVDLVDGPIARLQGLTSRFGERIDSIADIITFCLFPSIVLFNAFGRSDFAGTPLPITAAAVYFLAASSREFRQRSDDDRFRGFPNAPISCATIPFMLQAESPETLLLLILPTLGMTSCLRMLPTLSRLKNSSPVLVPIAAVSYFAVAILAPVTLLVLANVLMLCALVSASTRLWEHTLSLHGAFIDIRTSREFANISHGIYTFFVRDTWGLLLAVSNLLRVPEDVLVITGNKFGGRRSEDFLRRQGFSVLRVDPENPLTWRSAYRLARKFPIIVLSADGPYGPYLQAKKGGQWLSSATGRPLYLLGIQSSASLTLKPVRGGLKIPLPFSRLQVFRKGRTPKWEREDFLHC